MLRNRYKDGRIISIFEEKRLIAEQEKKEHLEWLMSMDGKYVWYDEGMVLRLYYLKRAGEFSFSLYYCDPQLSHAEPRVFPVGSRRRVRLATDEEVILARLQGDIV